jgi:hypothetical protein
MLIASLLYWHEIQVALARLEALESDNVGAEIIEVNGDEYDSMDEDDQGTHIHIFMHYYTVR